MQSAWPRVKTPLFTTSTAEGASVTRVPQYLRLVKCGENKCYSLLSTFYSIIYLANHNKKIFQTT